MDFWIFLDMDFYQWIIDMDFYQWIFLDKLYKLGLMENFFFQISESFFKWTTFFLILK